MWQTLSVLTAAIGLLTGLTATAALGDEGAALAELIDRNYERVYAYLRRLCSSPCGRHRAGHSLGPQPPT